LCEENNPESLTEKAAAEKDLITENGEEKRNNKEMKKFIAGKK
jgi:hypothetical protein